VFLGPSSVGKSAIIERFVQERFDTCKKVTIELTIANSWYWFFSQKCTLWRSNL